MTISDLINYIELKLNLFIPNIEGYLQTITEIYRVSVQSLIILFFETNDKLQEIGSAWVWAWLIPLYKCLSEK